MIRALIIACALAGCVSSDDRPVEAPSAWGDPMSDCSRFTCAEVTDCERYDEGIVCACRYEDGLARSCELTDEDMIRGLTP